MHQTAPSAHGTASVPAGAVAALHRHNGERLLRAVTPATARPVTLHDSGGTGRTVQRAPAVLPTVRPVAPIQQPTQPTQPTQQPIQQPTQQSVQRSVQQPPPQPASRRVETATRQKQQATRQEQPRPPGQKELDELARRLYGPISRRLKSELRTDRERAGRGWTA